MVVVKPVPMIYSKNSNNALLLETELKRLKKLYSESLQKENSVNTVKDLRKRIKVLSNRLVTADHSLTSSRG
jgi:hypothetical protein